MRGSSASSADEGRFSPAHDLYHKPDREHSVALHSEVVLVLKPTRICPIPCQEGFYGCATTAPRWLPNLD